MEPIYQLLHHSRQLLPNDATYTTLDFTIPSETESEKGKGTSLIDKTAD